MNSNDQIKLFTLMMRMWLAGVAIGIGGTIYFLIIKDNDSAVFFFGFFILSAVLYLLRKRQIKNRREAEEKNSVK